MRTFGNANRKCPFLDHGRLARLFRIEEAATCAVHSLNTMCAAATVRVAKDVMKLSGGSLSPDEPKNLISPGSELNRVLLLEWAFLTFS
jgi:hypothetical protein